MDIYRSLIDGTMIFNSQCLFLYFYWLLQTCSFLEFLRISLLDIFVLSIMFLFFVCFGIKMKVEWRQVWKLLSIHLSCMYIKTWFWYGKHKNHVSKMFHHGFLKLSCAMPIIFNGPFSVYIILSSTVLLRRLPFNSMLQLLPTDEASMSGCKPTFTNM